MSADDIKVFDMDNKCNEYEMVFRTDGSFKNNFTSNILSVNAELTLKLIRLKRYGTP